MTKKGMCGLVRDESEIKAEISAEISLMAGPFIARGWGITRIVYRQCFTPWVILKADPTDHAIRAANCSE